MSSLLRAGIAALSLAALTPAGFADGRNPGSLLVYPIHRSGGAFFTVLCVTNSNTVPSTPFSFGGTTNVIYNYVNVIPNPADSQLPLGCVIVDRVETLTPADTLCVLTTCHNASGGQEGYVVVIAQDPSKFKTNWSFDYLIGSEMVVTALGGVYSINAIPFESPEAPEGDETDFDGDGEADFDGLEYEGIPDELYIDSFVAAANSSLTLLNLTGGPEFTAAVAFDIWNDNEQPLSATKLFKCWFEEPLQNVSLVFSESYLKNNTPHDPQELDLDCDNVGDLETGWAIISGINASSPVETIPDPALLGAITSGPVGTTIDGGRLLWESAAKQFNGDFLNLGTDDDEF